jgi:nicotinamidase-related amidase
MRTALIVVDMLNDFVDGVLGNPAAEKIVAPIASLVEGARENDDWVVVYANDAHRRDDVELRVFPPHAMVGTPGAAVIDDLQPGPGDLVVDKRFYSAFTETDLQGMLRARAVGRIVLVGQHTDCCVRHTSYDAFARGYELVVCPNATTVFEPGSDEPVPVRQHRALEYLQAYYGAHLEESSAVG